jgi:hypothetical protein
MSCFAVLGRCGWHLNGRCARHHLCERRIKSYESHLEYLADHKSRRSFKTYVLSVVLTTSTTCTPTFGGPSPASTRWMSTASSVPDRFRARANTLELAPNQRMRQRLTGCIDRTNPDLRFSREGGPSLFKSRRRADRKSLCGHARKPWKRSRRSIRGSYRRRSAVRLRQTSCRAEHALLALLPLRGGSCCAKAALVPAMRATAATAINNLFIAEFPCEKLPARPWTGPIGALKFVQHTIVDFSGSVRCWEITVGPGATEII